MKKFELILVRIHRSLIMAVAFITIIIALAVLVADQVGWDIPLREQMPSLTLLLLSTFVVCYFAREPLLADLARWNALGVEAVYRGRDDPDQAPRYLELLNSAHEDLFIVGITLKDVPRLERDALLNAGSRQCATKLLMMNPRYWKNKDPVLDPVAAATAGDLHAYFELAIRHMRTLAVDMAESRGDMEVRFYNQAPTMSLTVADGHLASGRMRVELTPHNTLRHGYFRPMLDLCQAGEQDLFGKFYRHYRALWDESEWYLRVQDSRIVVNEEVDKAISRILRLPLDWHTPDVRAERQLAHS